MDRSFGMTLATVIGSENIKELHKVYKSSHIIRVIKSKDVMCGVCGRYGRDHKCIQGFGTDLDGEGRKICNGYLSPNNMSLRRTGGEI